MKSKSHFLLKLVLAITIMAGFGAVVGKSATTTGTAVNGSAALPGRTTTCSGISNCQKLAAACEAAGGTYTANNTVNSSGTCTVP